MSGQWNSKQGTRPGAPLKQEPPKPGISLEQYNRECALADAHDVEVRKKRFLEIYLETGNAAHSAREIGLYPNYVNNIWQRYDPVFAEAYKEAKLKFEAEGAADREAKRKLFLELFAQNGNYTRSCKEAGLQVFTVEKWIDRDVEFRQRYDIAKQTAADAIEEALRERAINGVVVEHPDFTETKYSDNGAIFLLKGQKREKYGDKVETEIKGKIDINITAATLAKAIVAERKKALESPTIDIDATATED